MIVLFELFKDNFMAENMPKRSEAEKTTIEKESDIQIDLAKVILIETTQFDLQIKLPIT